jgi:hypothetical protein
MKELQNMYIAGRYQSVGQEDAGIMRNTYKITEMMTKNIGHENGRVCDNRTEH